MMGTLLAHLPWRRRGRRAPLLVVVLVALVAGLGTGAAWASFSSDGSAHTTVSVGTAQQVTLVAATGTPSSLLRPGHSADLTLTLDNPNSFAVTITAIAQDGTPTVVGGSTCTAANAAVTVPSQTGLSVVVAPGTGVVVHIPGGGFMGATSADGCQGATFHFPVTITVVKQ